MKRFLYTLSLIFSLAILCHTDASAQYGTEGEKACRALPAGNATHRKDALYEVTNGENSHEAIVENTARSYRVADSRSLRTLPTYAPGSGAATAGIPSFFHHNITHYCRSLHVRPTAPIRLGVSARYYVFALRHILC